jgi:hypothetical protein
VKYRFLDHARQELIEAGVYYVSQNRKLVDDLEYEVDRALSYLCEFPRAAKPIDRIHRSHKVSPLSISPYIPDGRRGADYRRGGAYVPQASLLAKAHREPLKSLASLRGRPEELDHTHPWRGAVWKERVCGAAYHSAAAALGLLRDGAGTRR